MLKKITPIIKQYLDIKKKYKNSLLFYQIGDFYEFFYDDAIKISKLLYIKLTKKKFINQNDVPMAGIPIISSKNYIYKLINLGETIVICNQINNFDFINKHKKLIKRKVVRIITPGTLIEEDYLKFSSDNYISCIYYKNNVFGYSYIDISSGRFYLLETDNLEILKYELLYSNPVEILCPKKFKFLYIINYIKFLKFLSLNEFNYDKNYNYLLNHFNVKNLYHFGIKDNNLGIICAGCLLKYIKITQFNNFLHINDLKLKKISKFIFMDYSTIKNLELVNSISGNKKNTLFYILNNTCTPMGYRMLKRWLISPLNDFKEIIYRHNIMNEFKYNFNNIRIILKKIGDIERILGRISLKISSKKDLINLRFYLNFVINLINIFNRKCNLYIINYFFSKIKIINKIINLISISIYNEKKINNNLILNGYSSKLDKLNKFKLKIKNKIILLENYEKKKNNINSLFFNYSKRYGYYVQICKSEINLVPDYYINYKNFSNFSIYFFKNLKKYEFFLFSIKKRILILEKKIFNDILNKIIFYINDLKLLSYYIAKIDILTNFLERSFLYNYKKPFFTNKSIIKIKNGRHPILENNCNKVFVSNNLFFDNNKRIYIITGPNMGGKSTYMRQAALIVIMTYIGCYVPADKLLIGPIDKILSRIGFFDDILSNKSTFMVELNDIYNIIKNSTNNSLVLIDEMGRGTSFYEGVSLAWSCLFYISKYIKCMTLFSTHFIELTRIVDYLNNVNNIYFNFLNFKNNIIFLYKVKKGICNKSLGLNLAKKIGMPKYILNIAKKKFNEFNNFNFKINNLFKYNYCLNKKHYYIIKLLSDIKFDNLNFDKLLKKIKKIKKIININK